MTHRVSDAGQPCDSLSIYTHKRALLSEGNLSNKLRNTDLNVASSVPNPNPNPNPDQIFPHSFSGDLVLLMCLLNEAQVKNST